MSDTYKDHGHPPGWENEHDPRCQACAQSELASSDGSQLVTVSDAIQWAEQSMNTPNIPPPTFETVRDILVEQLGVDPARIRPDSHLENDLGADSLDQVEIVMAFELAFDLDISDEEAEKITTPQQILDFLKASHMTVPGCGDPIVEGLCSRLLNGGTMFIPSLIDKLRARSRVGQAKYGSTMARTDITRAEWLKHAQDEALDLVVYLEKLLSNPGNEAMRWMQAVSVELAATLESELIGESAAQ